MKVVSHIPHASLMIPEDVRGQFVLSDQQLRAELRLMTDRSTDELFGEATPGAADVVFPVSRLVVDPERFENDVDEPMASVGMGVIYEKTSARGSLRREISSDERRLLIESYYRPHHDRLTAAVREKRETVI
jgi:N-formylglutamate deformylase